MTPSQVNDSNDFTIQACGGMQRKGGGEGERTHRDWCCEEGKEVGNGREIPTSVIIKGMKCERNIEESRLSISAEIFG